MNPAGNEPKYISILGEIVTISKIERHPNYTKVVAKDNVALIRLESYLKPNNDIAPACVTAGSYDYGLSSLKILRNVSVNVKEQIFVPVHHKCDGEMLSNANISGVIYGNVDCWNTDYRLLPELCEIDEGGPLLNRGHSSLQGINVVAGECGTPSSMIVLKLDSYMAWIESFVLDRSVTPEPSLTFPVDDTSSLFFKPCRTREGVDGSCLDHWGCAAEVERQKRNGTGVTMCGFEGDMGFICCPKDSIGKVPLVIARPPLIPLIEPLIELQTIKP